MNNSLGWLEQIKWKHARDTDLARVITLLTYGYFISKEKIIQPHYTQSLIRKLSLKSCDFVTSCLNSTKEMKPEPLRSVSSRTFLTTSICKAEQLENILKVYQSPSLSPACPRSPGPRPAPSGQSGRTRSCKCRLCEKYKVRTFFK